MPGRFGRRNGSSLFRILMGLALAGTLRRAFVRRAQSGRGAPLLLVLMLLCAFLGIGVLLTVLGSIVSLFGGTGAAMLLCLAPAAVLLLVMLAIAQGQSRSQQSTGAATVTTANSAQAAQVETPEPACAPQQPRATEARWAPPAAAIPRQTAPRPIATIEKGACAPADYRQRAASYRRRIQSLVKNRRPGPLAERLAGVSAKLASWEERVGQLADRVALFENDDLIRRDIKEVPRHIARLRRQVALETDPEMSRQMARTLAAYEQQQHHLAALARVMRRTRLNLDDTLAAMGTIYSQAQVLNALDIDGAAAARIADDIEHEVTRLNDLLSALSEVNAGQINETETVQSAALDADNGLAARRARLERGGGAG